MSATLIKSSNEIGQVLKEGQRIRSSFFTIYSNKTPAQRDQHGRVAFIAGKKHGNAVWRNRSKRLLRAAFQEAGFNLPGLDIVIIANGNIHDSNSRILAEELSTKLVQLAKMAR